MPPLAIPSLEFERPRTAQEYGLSAARQALKRRFPVKAGMPHVTGAIGAPCSQQNLAIFG